MEHPSDSSAEQAPSPEVLQPRADNDSGSGMAGNAAPAADTVPAREATPPKSYHHRTYRPSHKATFLGLVAVVVVLAINAAMIFYVLKSSGANKKTDTHAEVAISQSALEKVGVNRTALADSGVQLVVDPNAKFNGRVTVGGDINVAGQFKLNNKFSANDASLAQLDAGNTSLSRLNVNGDSTVTNLNTRSDLSVTGTTRLQGPVNLAQLLTVNNSVNITGNLSVGGTMAINGFQSNTLTSTGTFTVGGHVITRGNPPTVTPGPALGQNGTTTVGGSDTAGTVAANFGVNAGPGLVATITFNSRYANVPRVVVTAVGGLAGGLYINRTNTGFSIYVTGSTPPGGYAFDYIVMQ